MSAQTKCVNGHNDWYPIVTGEQADFDKVMKDTAKYTTVYFKQCKICTTTSITSCTKKEYMKEQVKKDV